MKTIEHWADTPEGRERYRANEPTIEVFIKDVEELEKSQTALEETLRLCGKCQEERKARDAKLKEKIKKEIEDNRVAQDEWDAGYECGLEGVLSFLEEEEAKTK